jgi:hypothetical protein
MKPVTQVPCVDRLPEPVDNVAHGLRNLAEYGFNIHRRYISRDMVERLKDRVIEQAEMERELGVANIGGPGGATDLIDWKPGDPHVYQLVDFLPNKGRVFIDLLMNEIALGYASGLFDPLPFRVGLTGALISNRGMRRQFLHRDEIAIPHDMCTRPTLLNILLCLSDFEEEMGATHIAPGTHLLPPPWDVPDAEQVTLLPAIAEAGDALMWEGRTWHAGGPHRSDKTRYAISTWYSLAGVTPDQIYNASLHDDVYDTLTTRELEILGFRVQLDNTYINRIAPRNPNDRQRNTNRATPYVPELHRN